MWPFKSDRKTLEEKLSFLKGLGFCLEEHFGPEDLLKNWTRKQYEKAGFESVLVGLGDFEGQPPWRPYCKNIWHFDTECIEDTGSYTQIANRMMEMSGGSLILGNIQDHLDVEDGEAWLEFECNGKPFHVDCSVKDDWVDPAVFEPFIDLLEKADPNKLFLYHGLFGQDCILACSTKEQYERLRFAGINFEPLKAEKLR